VSELPEAEIRRVVRAALEEDLGRQGDVTTRSIFARPRPVAARIVARQPLVLAGIPLVREVFHSLDPQLRLVATHEDGTALDPGTVVATLDGDARGILEGERTALNFLMRLSGIASAARAAALEIEGTGARVLDTRKTAPGLRRLDKYAVACGGGTNHRMGLYDAVMVKDTHLAVAGSIPDAVAAVFDAGHHPSAVTVEVRDLKQLDEAIEAGAGRALLDNMSVERLREAVQRAAGRIVLEASGGLRPGRLREVAETGVDFLSLGFLTHSAPAADLAMEIDSPAAG